MKLELSLGSDTPRGGALVPILKLAVVGLAALLVVNRADLRRYLRLRRM
jgi:hypothetical protein